MINKKQVLGKTMKQIASKMVQADFDGWPPHCALLTYQPKRPTLPSKQKQEKQQVQL